MNAMTRRTITLGLLLAGCLSGAAFAADSANEDAQILVLQQDSSWEGKEAACRALRQVGTAKAVPVLASLLGDPTLSHLARYALESMPCAEAAQALRDALVKTEGLPRTGIAISLGVRRDAEAAPLLASLLTDADVDTAKAAAGALGRIGTMESVSALQSVQSTVQEPLRVAVAEGLLAGAENLEAAGQTAAAESVYASLIGPEWPMHVRLGAYRGKAYVRPSETGKVVLDTLWDATQGAKFLGAAAQIVAETSGETWTLRYAEELPKLDPERQAILLRGLARRGDVAARPAVVAATAHADKGVRLAAIRALASLGDAQDVNPLAEWMASEDADIAAEARAALASVERPGVNEALVAAMTGAPGEVHARLLALLTERRAPAALPQALAGLGDPALEVRMEALKSMSILGESGDASAVLEALRKASDETERAAAEKTLGDLASRHGEALLPLVLETMQGGTGSLRVAMLHTLGRMGGAPALAEVRKAVDDPDKAFGNEALREVSDWATADAAPLLLELAQSKEEDRHVLGLRGYVRVARAEGNADAKAGMLDTAMSLAASAEEKWMVLAAWGTLEAPRTLDALLPHLQDPEVRKEAAGVIVAVAGKMRKDNPQQKARAIEALKAVIEACPEGAVHDNAQRTLDQLGR